MADFEGWLEKAGGITGKTNQKRYFVFKGGALYYYKDKPADDNAKEQGILELAGTTFGDFGMGSSWSISGGNLKKTYTLTAADQEERSTWIDKLSPACAMPNEEKAPPQLTQEHEDFLNAAGTGDMDVMCDAWKFDDLNFKDKYGCTACHRAADSGKLKVLQYLHGKGADLNAKDNYGETPCDKASGETKQWLQDKARGLYEYHLDVTTFKGVEEGCNGEDTHPCKHDASKPLSVSNCYWCKNCSVRFQPPCPKCGTTEGRSTSTCGETQYLHICVKGNGGCGHKWETVALPIENPPTAKEEEAE